MRAWLPGDRVGRLANRDEDLGVLLGARIEEGLDVPLRDDERVAGRYRKDIPQRQRQASLREDAGRQGEHRRGRPGSSW